MSDARTTGPLTLTRAVALSDTSIDLAASPDADDVGFPFTRLLRLADGVWTTRDIDMQVESLCHQTRPHGGTVLLAMSRDGQLRDAIDGGPLPRISDAKLVDSNYRMGFRLKLRSIDGDLFACGDGGQFYAKQAGGGWSIVDKGLLTPKAQSQDWLLEILRNPELAAMPGAMDQVAKRVQSEAGKAFWSVAGRKDRVYVCGDQGVLHLWDGAGTSVIATNVEADLRDILVQDDGTIYICGRDGTLLRGLEGEAGVRRIGSPGTQNFVSLAMFGGSLYLASTSAPRGLFILKGETLVRATSSLSPEIGDVHTLSACGGVLWVVGSKLLIRFDGNEWRRVPVPGV